MTYYWIKQLHIATVVFTVAFFTLRYFWMLQHPNPVQKAWARYLSVFNDTLLLIAGISLAVMSSQYPLQSSWLSAKLAALLVYIILGSLALKRGRTRSSRALFGILALACVGYIIWVALTRSPIPWSTLGY